MNATLAPDRAAIPVFPAADGDQAWQLLDDPAEWPAFGRELGAAGAGCWESQVVVEGMHCAACAFTVEAALRQVPGVMEVQVNAASRRARVVWSPAQARPSHWFEASAKAGYRLLPGSDRSVRECAGANRGWPCGAGSCRASA